MHLVLRGSGMGLAAFYRPRCSCWRQGTSTTAKTVGSPRFLAAGNTTPVYGNKVGFDAFGTAHTLHFRLTVNPQRDTIAPRRL